MEALSILPSASVFAAFLAASIVLAVTPGPGVLYIVARSIAEGRRAGLVSVAAVAAGNSANAMGAALGLAALFAVSSAAFTIVKWAGAAYLIYLGIRMLRTPAGETDAPGASASSGRVFRDGFLVALLNPKTALFFAAFLPQFVSPAASVAAQTMLLSSLFVLIAVISDILYVLVASAASRRLLSSLRLQRRARILSGGTFIGLGLLSAFAGDRAVRR